jgi:glutamine cyclotransferase
MVQLVLSAAQGDEAKSFTILGIGMLAGFSGDANITAQFEALNNELSELSLGDLVDRLGDLFQGTSVTASRIEQPDGTGLWLSYQTEFYAQATLILVRGEEYVSLSLLGSEIQAPDALSNLGELVFDRLPPAFYNLDPEADGSFSIELGDDGDTSGEAQSSEVTETPQHEPGQVWVTAPNAGQVFAIDPVSNEVSATIEVGRFPGDVVVAAGNVWVVSETEGVVWRIDPTTYEVVETIQLNGNTLHLEATPDALWVVGGLGVRSIDFSTGTRHDAVYNRCYDVAAGEGAIWVSQSGDNQLLQIDPSSHRVVATVKLEGGPTGIVYGHDLVWTVLSDPKELVIIDPVTGEVVHQESYMYVVHGMAVGPENLWYTHPTALLSIQPMTWETGGFGTATGPARIVYFDGSLWATSGQAGKITRYDPESGEVIAEISLGVDTKGIAAGE